jgi:hypothetical protein
MAIETTAAGKDQVNSRIATLIAGTLAAGLSMLCGSAIGRLLYEWRFPALAWLGRPVASLLLALVVSIVGLLLWHRLFRMLWRRHPDRQGACWSALLPFLPLFPLNLVYVMDPFVNLVRGPLFFLASLWLALLLLARLVVRTDRWRWLAYVFIVTFLLPIYLATMGRTVGAADTFEFQVVVPRLGIVHPTGYPLYLLLAKPFTWLPFGSVAWRVNLATMLFGLVAAGLLYALIRRWTGWIVPAVLAGGVFGLTPTFWSQAIEAEVYSLHALIVVGALLLMREIGGWKLGTGGWWLAAWGWESEAGEQYSVDVRSAYRLTVLLAFVLGLGLTNHLTTVMLLPAAGLTVFLAHRQGRYDGANDSLSRAMLLSAGAFLLPLVLYAYLPIRWAAVNGEAMGLRRFVDWVIGGRFQGALQLAAWLKDGARYTIVGRLLTAEWPIAWGLLLILIGLAYACYRNWRFTLVLVVAWLGYVFYALNYYVPDLTVFLIPAYLIMAIFWVAGLVGFLALAGRFHTKSGRNFTGLVQAYILLMVAAAALVSADEAWARLDRSVDDGRTRWGQAVLDLPLTTGAAILADSDKYPPLYYLQQAEGIRPDLDIVVLPDEAAYRAELDERLAGGQTVYLARFLPGLESIYHLRSLGPLVEVSQAPITAPPAVSAPLVGDFGPIQLLGYQLALESPYTGGESAITLYWRATEPLQDVLQVYARWAGEDFTGPATSQHPAGNTYPTVAWRAGEVVVDFHALPLPVLASPAGVVLQVALAPPFTPPEELAWQGVAAVDGAAIQAVLAKEGQVAGAEPLRMLLGPVSLGSVAITAPVRSQTPLTVRLLGYAESPASLQLAVIPAGDDPKTASWRKVDPASLPGPKAGVNGHLSLEWTGQLGADYASGSYEGLARNVGQPARCGWLARQADFCVLGRLSLSDAMLPPGAVRFDDKVALLSVDVPEKQLAPGGELALTVTWQALAKMDEDYTVFVQVLDDRDHIVGQVDAWPQQGTYPTSGWAPGEIVEDPYLVRLDPDLAPGHYKLYVGWYLLETLRRLPVLDQNGQAVDDKVAVPGLVASG